MSAKTPWWLCGRCGFSNHPRDPRSYNLPESEFHTVNERCEQCGAPREDEFAQDYIPASHY